MTNKRIFGMVIGEMGVYILCSAIWLGFPATGFAGECPQDRKTITAPQEFLNMQNPLAPDERTLKAGENLFQNEARPIACKFCHGVKGDGKSGPDFESTPPPRNFTCAETMKKLPDGQLFWIIKNGSKNTSMFAFSDLTNNQIWQLVHYVQSFGK